MYKRKAFECITQHGGTSNLSAETWRISPRAPQTDYYYTYETNTYSTLPSKRFLDPITTAPICA